MLGIILTGHGKFASGIASGIDVIAGPQVKFKAIDFAKNMTSDELRNLYIETIEEFGTKEGIVFMTDIAGGTPFNQASMISADTDDIGIIAGANTPLIMEGIFQRELSVQEFIKFTLEKGKAGIIDFQFKAKKEVIHENQGI